MKRVTKVVCSTAWLFNYLEVCVILQFNFGISLCVSSLCVKWCWCCIVLVTPKKDMSLKWKVHELGRFCLRHGVCMSVGHLVFSAWPRRIHAFWHPVTEFFFSVHHILHIHVCPFLSAEQRLYGLQVLAAQFRIYESMGQRLKSFRCRLLVFFYFIFVPIFGLQ